MWQIANCNGRSGTTAGGLMEVPLFLFLGLTVVAGQHLLPPFL